MPDYQIEIAAERMQDRLDEEFLTTAMTQEEYYARCREIVAWVDARYEENA